MQAPNNKKLKIVEFSGGQEMHRRLLALGVHKNDILELDSKSILKGPILIRNLNSETSFALGRGIAEKIMVEVLDEEK